jgi:hypothetical protein
MNREVIQDFLNLPGIVGVALTNRRMRPYFQGLNANLDERQQQALAQGILQVLENMPEGFDAFEFYFAGNIVFIYKLAHSLVLLVLTDQYLDIKTYRYAIAKIRQTVDADVYNAVATFKLLLGSVSQTSLAWAKPTANHPVAADKTALQAQVTTIQTNPTNPNSPPATSKTAKNYQSNHHQTKPTTDQPTNNHKSKSGANSTAPGSISNTNSNANDQETSKQSAQPASSKPATKPVSAKSSPQTYKLDELLAAMNQVSTFTTQYLGKVVVKNYWSSCRPKSIEWLQEFEFDRSGRISHPRAATMECDPQQRSQLQTWVNAYIKRCQLVIRNFDSMVIHDCLEPEQTKLLLDK